MPQMDRFWQNLCLKSSIVPMQPLKAMVESYLWIIHQENCLNKICQEFCCQNRLFQRVENQSFVIWTKWNKNGWLFALDNIYDPFKGQECSTVGFWGVSGVLATPSKNQVPRVQEIRPKWTWLGFLDPPRYQSDWKCLPRSHNLQNGVWHQFHFKGDVNMAARWSSYFLTHFALAKMHY